jgi:hypothetical protein
MCCIRLNKKNYGRSTPLLRFDAIESEKLERRIYGFRGEMKVVGVGNRLNHEKNGGENYLRTTLGNEALGEMDEPPRRPDPSMSCRCTSQGRLIESPPPMLGRAASHRRSPPPRPTDAEEDAESLSTPPGRAGRVAVAACPRASLPLVSSPVRRRHLQRQTRRTRDTPKC